jgi:gamma-glutamylcyclotransferase (GGCT)/AIG2-like uncharacterized protein YtfP
MASEHQEWYFAYGSNLDTAQMVERIGPFIRRREARRAWLDGYRLAFNKKGLDGTGRANIVPDPAGTVWGVVYLTTPEDLSKMDQYEGVPSGHYQRKTVRVRFEDGVELDAVTYVASSAFVDNSLRPSYDYLQAILKGAREHKLPEDYIISIDRLAKQ